MKKVGKKSLIGGILALSLILGGTGYAYWTDTLNITTKATTGEFGMKFVDLGLYAQYSDEINTDGAKGWSIVDGIDKGYVESDFFERGTQYNKIAKDGSIEKYKERQKGYSNTEFDAKLKDAAPLKKQVGPYNSANTNGSSECRKHRCEAWKHEVHRFQQGQGCQHREGYARYRALYASGAV